MVAEGKVPLAGADIPSQGVKWTPSKMIARLGKEINNPESVYYWAQKVRSWTSFTFSHLGSQCCSHHLHS